MFEYVVMNDDDVDGDDECFGPNIIIIMLSVILRGLFSSDPTADTTCGKLDCMSHNFWRVMSASTPFAALGNKLG